MIELAGKTALVTGAGVRIGAEIATALGAQGMRVGVHYHASEQDALATCREIERAGGQAVPLRANLFDRAETERLVDRALQEFGRLDLLVPSAANFERVEFADIDHGHFTRALELNLWSAFQLAQRAAPALRSTAGSIVLITCASRVAPYRHYLPYEISKAALHQLMQLLALELAPDVRVNSVAPGTVLPPADMPQSALSSIVRNIPLQKVWGARSVAEAVVYLARASFLTGTELLVDGGRSLSS
jgi:pteridine reductase